MPTNQERISYARTALNAYDGAKGFEGDDLDGRATDLLTDFGHLLIEHGLDPSALFERAQRHLAHESQAQQRPPLSGEPLPVIRDLRILSADRSSNNESEAKGMSGCLSSDSIVLAYFPTARAGRIMADLLGLSAPQMPIGKLARPKAKQALTLPSPTTEERAAYRAALMEAWKHVTASRDLCATLGIIKAACACDEAVEAIDSEIAAMARPES